MAENAATIIGLRQLQVGQRARICSVSASGEMGRRIRDMGLVPGTEVSVIGRAPLRDPVALRIKAFTLTLRNSEADNITVSPV
ncbi:FeoA family protein [Solidesulfovibrio sp.]